MAEVIKRTQPAIFIAENVKGLLSAHDGKALEIIEKDFGKLGYSISTQLYLAANYGVPQSRERVIIVGTNKKKSLPKFEHIKPIFHQKDWITLRKAIGDLSNKKEGAIANHYWSKAKMFPGTQGNSTVSAGKIGPTMRSEHHGNIEWHWNRKRRLSAREAARIQSFPDNFIFKPSTSSAYKQIGNAVPPVMGWHIAKSIEKFLDKNLK
jgi:DNA (cytosine-5)-methyltransferase 1